MIQKNSNTLKCHFVNLDTNHSGTIAIEKFLDILHKLNIPESILTKQDALNLTERFVNNIGLKYVDFLNFYNEGKKENEI